MRASLVCRGTTAVLAVLVVLQPVLAGGFLSGHYDLLRLHLYAGLAMLAVAVAQAVAVVFLRRAGGPRSVLVAGLMLPVLIALEGILGTARVLTLHFPIGVLMVLGLLRLAGQVWGSRPAPVVEVRS